METLVATNAGSKNAGRYGRNLVLAVLVLLAGAEFVLRGPARFLQIHGGWDDLTPVYVPSRAWLKGLNPYEPKNFSSIWKASSGQEISVDSVRSHAAYPLSAIVVMAPLAAISWGPVQYVWLAINLFLLLAMTSSLSRFANLDGWKRFALIAFVLGLAPLHTGLATGNVTIAAFTLAVLGVCVPIDGNRFLAGILIAVAFCLKPQIGILFWFYYTLRREWAVAFSTVAVAAGVLLLGALRLHAYGFVWVADFLRNAHEFVTSNPVDDFVTQNPIRFTLVNLQVPFYEMTNSRTLANGLALGVGVTLGVAWLALFLRNSRLRELTPKDKLLDLSVLAITSLLAVYHRFYDATVLILVFCWVLVAQGSRLRWMRILVCFTLLPFLLPGATFLQQLGATGRISLQIQSTWWWNRLIMPHEIWALCLVIAFLLRAKMLEGPGRNAILN